MVGVRHRQGPTIQFGPKSSALFTVCTKCAKMLLSSKIQTLAMNLSHALLSTPLTWSVTHGEALSKRTGKSIPVVTMKVVLNPGAEPVSKHFSSYSPPTIDDMLAAILAKYDPANPCYIKWLAARGETPVALEPGVMECLGEAMHRGLRKLADSKQSAITWNALHRVHPNDRGTVWKTAQEVLEKAFATGEPVTRRDLACELREAVENALDLAEMARPGNADGVSRSSEQHYALQTLLIGCQMTDIDEWMWSWLGYVVKDAAVEPAAAVAQAA